MSPLDDPSGWYEHEAQGAGLWLIRERHVHPFARCNIWLLRGRDRDLLIDSGTGLRPLAPWVASPVGRPLVALATHGHFDHVGALHEFQDRRAHRLEAPDYATMPDELTLAPLFRALPEPVTQPPRSGWSVAGYQVAAAPVAAPLDEGDRIELGDRTLTVLHLPGHSPGSIGLLDERNGILFSGDALYDGELIDDFPTSDVEAYLATMARLRALPIVAGHGGHGPSFDRARRDVLVEAYLAGRRARGCAHPH